MAKTSLMFVEDGLLKVAFGNSLKTIKFDDISKDYNRAFFEKLFKETKVLVVDGVSVLTADNFEAFLTQVSAPVGGRAEPEPQAAPEPAPEPEKKAQIKREVVADLVSPASGVFIKSNAKTTIIIDDLFTNQDVEIAPGQKKALAVSPDLPVNLSNLDPVQVRRSSILRRLIANGTFEPISAGEALKMEQEHEAKQAEEEKSSLDQWAPILDSGVSAKRYAEDKGRRSIADLAEPIDLTEEVSRPRTGPPSNEDSGLMSDLMNLIEEGQEAVSASGNEPPIEVESPRSQIAQRKRPDVSPGAKAKPIAKRTEESA